MKLPKLSFSNVLNLALLGLFLFVLNQRLPVLWNHFKMEGSETPSISISTLGGTDYHSKEDSERRALVFWATWCGPCDVELARIQEMIDDEELRPENILAISSYEEESLLREVVSERGYTFPVGVDSQGLAARKLGVSGTPTLVLKESDGTIAWMTNGLSPSLKFRLSRFFRDQ